MSERIFQIELTWEWEVGRAVKAASAFSTDLCDRYIFGITASDKDLMPVRDRHNSETLSTILLFTFGPK